MRAHTHTRAYTMYIYTHALVPLIRLRFTIHIIIHFTFSSRRYNVHNTTLPTPPTPPLLLIFLYLPPSYGYTILPPPPILPSLRCSLNNPNLYSPSSQSHLSLLSYFNFLLPLLPPPCYFPSHTPSVIHTSVNTLSPPSHPHHNSPLPYNSSLLPPSLTTTLSPPLSFLPHRNPPPHHHSPLPLSFLPHRNPPRHRHVKMKQKVQRPLSTDSITVKPAVDPSSPPPPPQPSSSPSPIPRPTPTNIRTNKDIKVS